MCKVYGMNFSIATSRRRSAPSIWKLFRWVLGSPIQSGKLELLLVLWFYVHFLFDFILQIRYIFKEFYHWHQFITRIFFCNNASKYEKRMIFNSNAFSFSQNKCRGGEKGNWYDITKEKIKCSLTIEKKGERESSCRRSILENDRATSVTDSWFSKTKEGKVAESH